MSIESALYAVLTAHTGLKALVGSRVHYEKLPDNATFPCVVVERVSSSHQQAFGSTQAVVVSRPRLRFTCWGTKAAGPAVALGVCAQVRAALLASGYAVTIDSEYDVPDTDASYLRRNLDVFVSHVGE